MIANETFIRIPRQLVDFFSHKTIFKPKITGANSQVHLAIGDTALPKGVNSPGQAGMNTASQLIEDGGEFIRTPFKWVKDMQANWLIYVICAAIICLCVLLLYCKGRRYFGSKSTSNTGFTTQLADIAMIMAKKQVIGGDTALDCTSTNP